MHLIADRFALDSDGHARDLATGEHVHLVVAPAGGVTDTTVWAERCAWFSRVGHASLAALVDYGALDASRRFETWGARSGWTGSPGAVAAARSRAVQFLRGMGRTPVAENALLIGTRGGQPCIIPDAGAGFPMPDTTTGTRAADRKILGVVRDTDPHLQRASALMVASDSGRLVAMQIWAQSPIDVLLSARELARAARLSGYVPVSAALVDGSWRGLVRGRTLVLLASGCVQEGWRCLIDAVLESHKPHIVVFIGDRSVRRVHGVPSARWTPEALIESVQPAQVARFFLRTIESAARRSGGDRARFERSVFGDVLAVAMADGVTAFATMQGEPGRGEGRARAERILRVAERVAAYTDGPTDPPEAQGSAAPLRAWPAPGELLRLRRMVALGRTLLRRGRHAAGDRTLRQAMHGFARRGESALAADAALALVQSLLDRGRHHDTIETLEHARAWASRAQDLAIVLRVALATAHLRMAQGHGGDAECVLETALEAAMSEGSEVTHEITLALVSCLFWQGRYAEGWHRLELLPDQGQRGGGLQSRVWSARARVSIGRGRPADGVACAARAREAAASTGDDRTVADAWHATALAQHAAGDREQAALAAAASLRAARAAHDPLQALEARLLGAELARLRGHRRCAVVLVKRLARLGPTLPHTLRARLDLLADLVTGADAASACERRVRSSGLPALRLFASASAPAPAPPPAADHIIELLQCCQAADDDVVVLTNVCARLRAHLRASGVAFYLGEHELAAVAGEGARIEPASALRIRTAGALVLPHRGGERPEAGTAVRFAGAVVGWLVAVWSPAATWHDADLTVLLSTGATAAAPALAGVAARRGRAQAAGSSELLGVSAAISAVRLAIEKAAGAPFAVLVEGESGCGKELVARLLHKLGPRRDRPFSTLNCAALPEDLVESELFGHARGAFTGAVGERRGVFEEAHTGTLFLDEIGELSARAQAKLLRAIQEGEIRRVGENTCRRVDVRLISATNRNLRLEAEAGRFRLDLLYRLDVIRIALPPLRERRDDVAVLATQFWRESTARIGSRALLSPAALAALARYDWPGNIRELQNVLASLAVRSPRRGLVPASALPVQFGERPAMNACRLDAARRSFDRAFIRAALVRAGGHRARAADELGVSRQGLAKLMARLDIADDCEHVVQV